VVAVLGVIAMLSVVGSAATALVHRPARTPAGSAPQWLRAHGLEVAVPGTRWRLEPTTSAVQYADASGAVRAQVNAPAVLDAGFCPSSRSSSRAFVGLLPPQQGKVPAVVNGQLGTWAVAIGGVPIPLPAVTGSRADIDVHVPAGPCQPTTAHLTLVGRATSAGVVVLVLVRDVGEPHDLSAAAADRIVQSLRSRT